MNLEDYGLWIELKTEKMNLEDRSKEHMVPFNQFNFDWVKGNTFIMRGYGYFYFIPYLNGFSKFSYESSTYRTDKLDELTLKVFKKYYSFVKDNLCI